MIIGICGPAGSGKTTVSDHLLMKYGGRKLAFAHDLKALVREAFNLDKSQVYGTQVEKEALDPRYNLSGRDFMTRVGEAAKKVWGDAFWTVMTIEDALISQALHPLTVIEDVRFPVEADAIVSEGGEVWLLDSPWAKSNADKSHASESSWRQCQYTNVICPSGFGLDLLYAEVERLANELGLDDLV